MNNLIDAYFDTNQKIHDAFGYVEDWVCIPIEDNREMFWHLTGEGAGDEVKYAKTKQDLLDVDAGQFYSAEIYTQRFLPKWVYRAQGMTMVCADTRTDGNKFLMIFDDSREVKQL